MAQAKGFCRHLAPSAGADAVQPPSPTAGRSVRSGIIAADGIAADDVDAAGVGADGITVDSIAAASIAADDVGVAGVDVVLRCSRSRRYRRCSSIPRGRVSEIPAESGLF